ncbi:MAG: thioredoxin domain-containing protein [Gammaproteobacteria bacterium]|nr:thioredoxin domain-containing protein [Gammaproteobacteria bacterium]
MHNNRLGNETSPYLLQHKDNPVEWYPWGKEALEIARQSNKPILLSIGYSACHWCHVMAHESFENTETAALMNELYINIKVDREERPDLDKIYQTSHSLLTQRSGGWPLTMFLTPDEQMPFFAGTYFPDEPRHGIPAFSVILQRVADAYKNNQESIQQQNTAIKDVFNKINEQDNNNSDSITAMPVDMAKNQLKKNFDPQYGGFGAAPKFPHPGNIEFAFKQWFHSVENHSEDFDMLNTATFTLEKMAEGGIFDQLGGGFSRYSVDKQWQIPHFEKMLYDNGPLLSAYAQAYTIIEIPLFKDTAIDTANWVMREMQSVNGGYYSSQDADSENIEGKYYVWTTDEIKQHIEPKQYGVFAEYFGLNLEANFEGKHWHLIKACHITALAEKYDIEVHQLKAQLNHNRQHLLKIREKRIRPATDDKILASWNGLMIKGMSLAGRVFDKPELIQSAQQALNFIKAHLWSKEGLAATHKDGKTQLRAYLDDYAFLLDAIVELLQAEWNNDYLDFANQLAETLLKEFEDTKHGGFYFTGHHHETLILRQKNYADDAIPSGNGIAAIALLKLGYLLSNTHYLSAAENTIKAAFNTITQSPVAHTTLLQALDIHLNNGMTTIIIRGDETTGQQWQSALNKLYKPQLQHFYLADNIHLPIELVGKKSLEQTCAYYCQGSSCSAPIFSLDELLSHI